MATTFKFGNKNWAVKEDYVLAYNDENDNFKPLPFDFTRATTATYVDSDGLIKTAQAGYARIDYTDNTDGHLLLEPSRTNLVTDSEELTYFTVNNASISSVSNTNPKGESGAIKYIPANGTGGNRSISKNVQNLSGLHTFSVFAKKDELRYLFLRLRNAPSDLAVFDLQDGVVSDVDQDGQLVANSAKIENYGNGWYRCSATFDPSGSNDAGRLYISFSADNTGTATNQFDGDGTSGLFLWGAQFEAGSYPTSYIPTEGSSVTRNADGIEQSGFQGKVMNATQGTIFIHFDNPIEDGDNNDFHMFRSAGGSGIENGFLFRLNTGTGVDILERVSNSTGAQFGNMVVKGQENKIAISFTSSTFLCSGNGVTKSYSGTYLGTKINIDEFQTSGATLQGFDIIDMKFYNTALTQEEINALTQL